MKRILFLFYHILIDEILQAMCNKILKLTLQDIVALDDDNNANEFHVSNDSVMLINDHIDKCESQIFSECELQSRYDKLLREIIDAEQKGRQTKTILRDIDLLFRQKSRGRYVYAEIKYNNHCAKGKYINVNMNLLLTYASLVRELEITSASQLKPILMFFDNKRMYGNGRVPERRHWRIFLKVRSLTKKFDALCDRILNEDYE